MLVGFEDVAEDVWVALVACGIAFHIELCSGFGCVLHFPLSYMRLPAGPWQWTLSVKLGKG